MRNIGNKNLILQEKDSNPAKALVIANLNNDRNKEIVKIIKDSFEDPSKFLELNENLIVNKKLKGPLFDENGKVIPRTIIGDRHIYEELEKMKNCNNAMRPTTGSIYSARKNIRNEENLEIISTKSLEDLFEKAEVRSEISKVKVNRYFNKLFSKAEKEKIYKQEKVLDNLERDNLSSARVSRAISSKIKRNNNELLMNRQHANRLKKQVKEIIDSQRPFEEKYGDHGWEISLRREKNISRLRTAYINIGSCNNEIWKPIIEFPQKKVELVQRPNTSSYLDMKYLEKNKYLLDKLKNEDVGIKEMQNLNKIEIKGKNLLEIEREVIDRAKGKIKIIYRHEKSELEENLKSIIIKQNYKKNNDK